MFSLDKIIDLLLPREPLLSLEKKSVIANDILAFLNQSLALAPWHIRFAEKILRVSLYAWLLLTGCLSQQASPAKIDTFLFRFQNFSNITNGIIRLYRSLTVLAFYEHPEVVAALGHLPATTHIEAQRHLRSKQLVEVNA